ncbi:hypothetical protein B0H13DRAFT_1866071 [Mycena leptocephala]|nr:hypothetical protein B0H13DRAFT_1866071 [Mycena leptocephala]
MPVFIEEPLITGPAPAVAVVIWNSTWNLGPFGMRMLPLNFNSKETWSTQGQMYSAEGICPFCGAGCFCFKPVIPEWPYYNIKQPKKNQEGLKKSLVHRPMSQRRSEPALSNADIRPMTEIKLGARNLREKNS